MGKSETEKARFLMVGGFLGAGKSTATIRFAEHLTRQGKRVGLITNDQSVGLVDTTLVKSHGFPVEEIGGGCFCCRFDSLVEAADALSKGEKPDVFIAEPVGCCTDLVAAVSYPMHRLYGGSYVIGPLSVLVDPLRARQILGLDPGESFSGEVRYIYAKQLEESDIVVVNKSDLLSPESLEQLVGFLRTHFPHSEVLSVSARYGTGLEPWFERLMTSELGNRQAMDVDYERYATGEAQLGWLNCTVRVSRPSAFDGVEWMVDLAKEMQRRLGAAGYEVAHLKMTLVPDGSDADAAVVNLVRNDAAPEITQPLSRPFGGGELRLNVRAEAPPDWLKEASSEALERSRDRLPDLELRVEHLEHFKPAKPEPTHRLVSLDVLPSP